MAGLFDAMDRLSLREKVMLAVMGSAIFAFVVFVGVFLVGTRLSEMRSGLEAKRQALQTLMDGKDDYLKRKAAGVGDVKAKIEGNDLNLTTFADQHAKAVGIQFDDYKDSKRPLFLRKRPQGGVKAKPDLLEEQLDVRFKRVGMAALTAFLDRVDREDRRPVAVKKLNVKTLWSARDKLSGTITLATWKKPPKEDE